MAKSLVGGINELAMDQQGLSAKLAEACKINANGRTYTEEALRGMADQIEQLEPEEVPSISFMSEHKAVAVPMEADTIRRVLTVAMVSLSVFGVAVAAAVTVAIALL